MNGLKVHIASLSQARIMYVPFAFILIFLVASLGVSLKHHLVPNRRK